MKEKSCNMSHDTADVGEWSLARLLTKQVMMWQSLQAVLIMQPITWLALLLSIIAAPCLILLNSPVVAAALFMFMLICLWVFFCFFFAVSRYVTLLSRTATRGLFLSAFSRLMCSAAMHEPVELLHSLATDLVTGSGEKQSGSVDVWCFQSWHHYNWHVICFFEQKYINPQHFLPRHIPTPVFPPKHTLLFWSAVSSRLVWVVNMRPEGLLWEINGLGYDW